jgi:hypothetical protein
VCDDLASDGSGDRVWRLRADPFGAEDGLFVDEAPLTAICVGQLRFDEARLRFISHPADDLTSDFWHLQMMARRALAGKSSGSGDRGQLRPGVAVVVAGSGICGRGPGVFAAIVTSAGSGRRRAAAG